MSLMSYTCQSAALEEELTLIITMPEKSCGEVLPFAAVVLIPSAALESSCFLREETLERYGRGPRPLATASLPGRVTKHSEAALTAFLVKELPLLLGQFPIKISAMYVQDPLSARLKEIESSLRSGYPGLKMNAAGETLAGFLGSFAETIPS